MSSTGDSRESGGCHAHSRRQAVLFTRPLLKHIFHTLGSCPEKLGILLSFLSYNVDLHNPGLTPVSTCRNLSIGPVSFGTRELKFVFTLIHKGGDRGVVGGMCVILRIGTQSNIAGKPIFCNKETLKSSCSNKRLFVYGNVWKIELYTDFENRIVR